MIGGYRRKWNLLKLLLCAILLVLFTFPNFSEEFNFGFGGEASNGDGALSDVQAKRVAKSRAMERKFKFRKLERVYADDANDEDDGASDDDGDGDDADDDEHNDSNGNNVKRQRIQPGKSRHERMSGSKRMYEQDENSHIDDGDDDDDGDNNDDDDVDNDNDDDDNENDSEEQRQSFRFEKARKSQKEHKSRPNQRDHSHAADTSTSLLSKLTFGLLGGNPTESGELESDSEDVAVKSNAIIDWLTWLGEKLAKRKTTTSKPHHEEHQTNGLKSYFNRWPFNAIFAIGKPPKAIRASPIAHHQPKSNSKHRSGHTGQHSSTMSQSELEALLYTLPSFAINPSHVSEPECRQQLQVFQRQLRGHKLWALQMLDATGKIPSGLLRGNINQFGDFEQCTQVRMLVKVTHEKPMRIRGKYCLAHIETTTSEPGLKLALHLTHGRDLWNSHLGNPNHFVPRYAVANWGVCVPHVCSADDVRQMINSNLRPYNATDVDFHVELDENDCHVQRTISFFKLFKNNEGFRWTAIILAGLVGLVVTATGHQHSKTLLDKMFASIERLKRKAPAASDTNADPETINELEPKTDDNATEEENATSTEIVNEPSGRESRLNSIKLLLQSIVPLLSLKSTLAHLLSTDHLDTQFPIFHVLKLVVTFMLYICMKFIMLGHLPIANRVQLARSLEHPLSVVYRTPLLYADILLLISGFMSAYQLSEEMEKNFHIPILKRITGKIARYLPTLFVVLCFQTWILPHLNAGPLWSNLIGENSRICEVELWRNLFSLQNTIDVEETCSFLSIQLAVEMQLYLLGPLIVWLYYSNSAAGFYAFGAIQALSVAARFSRTSSERLSAILFHGMNVSKFYRSANLLFASPISRATPYLLGIGAGILHRSNDGFLDVEAHYMPFGWTVCGLGLVWCFWSQAAAMRSDFVYSSSDAAAYAAWLPLILGMALVWLIFTFPKSENSLLRYITNSRPVLVLSRMCYPMQLCTYVVTLYNTAKVAESSNYQLHDMLDLSEIGTIVIFATLLTFFIDVPLHRACNAMIEYVFVERPDAEVAPTHEMSDGEISDEMAEPATDERTEAETIWASDPEEEEQKYLARRRSSTLSATAGDDNIKVEQEGAQEPVTETGNSSEVEEDKEITEEEEVKKRPINTSQDEPASTGYRRRRRPTTDE